MMIRITLILISFLTLSAQSYAQGEVDSTVLGVYNKFKQEFFSNSDQLHLVKDTILRYWTLNYDLTKKIKGWEYDFAALSEHGKPYFNDSETIYYPFSIRMLSNGPDRSSPFHFEGFIYKNEVYVNLKRYCLVKNQVRPDLLEGDSLYSFMEEFKKSFGLNYKIHKTWNGDLFEIKMKGFPKNNTYKPSLELNPIFYKMGKEYFPTNLTGLVANTYYYKYSDCSCSNYDPVVVFYDFDYRTSPKQKRHKASASHEEFIAFDYFLLRLSDYKIIQKGTFSNETLVKEK